MGSLLTGATDCFIPIRPLHASFYDFLTDEKRSGPFFIDISTVHEDLAFACVQIMQEELCFNICGLESSYLRNCDVIDLPEKIKKSIPPHLACSCCLWSKHIEQTDFCISIAQSVESIFHNVKILFWMEVLSLLKCINVGPSSLAIVAKWMQGGNCKDTVAFMYDAIKCLQHFGSVMEESTPHLYLSALPFCPAMSMLASKVGSSFLTLLKICLWDAETGDQVCNPLWGHTGKVLSVAFSPEGKWIASGSYDQVICLWDAETGRVWSVAFSPDGRRIASGSDDETICLWDVEIGVQAGNPVQGHTAAVQSAAFSPDGRRIVSGSTDWTLCLWNGETGVQVGNPLQGHTGTVWSVAFSPDGRRIASGSDDECHIHAKPRILSCPKSGSSARLDIPPLLPLFCPLFQFCCI
ncbi:hypothetical protein ID866_8788 [Astraeus odoratus]|nr:hypothetical protein ID866_8788 [Astraeus odoratus]